LLTSLKIQETDALVQTAEQQMQNALSNINAAMEYVRNGENEHPNRIDVCESSVKNPGQPFPVIGTGPPPTPNIVAVPVNPFGSSSVSTFAQQAGAFGQPSALGQKPNPFGSSAQSSVPFGQPTAAGAFGQPTALGQKPNPFGSPSVPVSQGQSNQNAQTGFSAFTAASNPFSTQPQPAVSNPFGQPSQAQPNPFGQGTSALPAGSFSVPVNSVQGSSSLRPNPFAAPPPTAQKNAFEVSSKPQQGSPFGQPQSRPPNPFNSSGTSATSTNPNPFGPSISTTPFTAPNPFGQAEIGLPSVPNPFGQRAPISVPNPFGQPGTTASSNPTPFGQSQPLVSSSAANPFGAVAGSTLNGASATNGIDENSPYSPQSSYKHPPLLSYASMDSSGQRLAMFKGKRVVYQEDQAGVQNRDGTWEKIWFPGGAPTYNEDTEFTDEAYDEKTKAAYVYMREKGLFPDGIMPLIPPKREYCLWNF
jgi:nucleoporin NUP42